MHFLLRHHVAGTHRSVVELAAFTDSDTTQRRSWKAGLIVDELELRLDHWWVVFCALAQIGVQRIGIHYFARVHLPVGIPYRLEFSEGRDQLQTKHLFQQLTTRLAVAVFAREGAPVFHHQVGCIFDEGPELRDAVARLQIEIGTGMHATCPKWPYSEPS